VAKKKKKATGVTGNSAAEPELATPAQAAAVPAAALAPPAESDVTLSWRWHVTALVVITAAILAEYHTALAAEQRGESAPIDPVDDRVLRAFDRTGDATP